MSRGLHKLLKGRYARLGSNAVEEVVQVGQYKSPFVDLITMCLPH